jgi:outer membrane protein TolC
VVAQRQVQGHRGDWGRRQAAGSARWSRSLRRNQHRPDPEHLDDSELLPLYGALVQLNLRITQPLYTFGKLTAAWDLGQTGLDIASAQSDGVRLDHQLNLLRAYFGLKSARAALDTVKEGHEQVTKWVKQMDIDLEAGRRGRPPRSI